jgi:Family of unknown function (DUF6639)
VPAQSNATALPDIISQPKAGGSAVNFEGLGAAGIAVSSALAASIYGGWDVYSRVERSPAMGEVRCDTPNVLVHSPQRADALIACEGARDATAFLASQGFEVTGNVAVDVVGALPADASPSAAGCYLAAEKRAVVLAYSEFSGYGTWFEVAIDPALYRSLVAHEVAHSIAANNFTLASPAVQAHEYIAYVTMFATMSPALRDRVLSKYPGNGFEDDAQMNATIYLFDPMRFGVQAYRHFLKQTSGREYLQAVLAGNALAE